MNKTIYKNISIGKLQDKGEVNSKRPTHSITVADEKFENKQTAGDLWTREGTFGKFLSGGLRQTKEYKDKDGNTQTQKGWSIISDEYLDFLLDEGDLPF